jgi:Zn-dependent protease with chaperone function
MQLSLFLMILLSLSFGTTTSTDSHLLSAASLSAFIVVTAGSFVHLLAQSSVTALRTGFLSHENASKRIERHLNAARWMSLPLAILCLHYAGLASAIGNLPILKDSLALQAFLLLLPGSCLFLSAISAGVHFDAMTHRRRSGMMNHLNAIVEDFRLSIGMTIIPILLLLGSVDAIAILPLNPKFAAVVNSALILVFIALFLPWIAGRLFRSKQLPVSEIEWTKVLAEQAGLGKTQISSWSTNQKNMNALAIGFVPPFKRLLVSDAIIEKLPREQVAMVILHEAAHLKRHHLLVRMLSILPIWGLAAVLTPWLDGNPWFAPTASVSCIVLTILVLRWVAYLTEYDADIEACRIADRIGSSVPNVPDDYQSACRELCRALITVTYQRRGSHRASWMHPGVIDRIKTVRAAAPPKPRKAQTPACPPISIPQQNFQNPVGTF